MRYEIIFSFEALDDLRRLSAQDRSTIRNAIETHLRHEPEKVSQSRIKRLRDFRRPEYRLRIDDFRVFYDIEKNDVEIIAVVPKSQFDEWLEQFGEKP